MKKAFSLVCLFIASICLAQTPEELVQQQLDAYNKRDIEAFLEPYSDSVKVYNFPDDFRFQGKETMRKGYSGMFDNMPDLNAQVLKRQALGNVVIDHEKVLFTKDRPELEVLVLYKIVANKIQEVWFIRPEN